MKLIYRKIKAKDRNNFRNVRAAALFFMITGGCMTLAGPVVLMSEPNNPNGEQASPLFMLLATAWGVVGVTGGFVARRAIPQWTPLVYVLAWLSIWMVIPSIALLRGYKRYLEGVEQVREELKNRST